MFTVLRMSYGKHFSSMYTGSMVGSGAMVFAVWGYVVANMRPENNRDRNSMMIVELNPKLLGPTLGEKPADVEEAIKFLCSPDPESRTREEEGRRLKDLGAFLYLVVNGRHYWRLRNEEERREYLRVAQQKVRDKTKVSQMGKRPKPLPGETAYVNALERGDEAGAAAIQEREAKRLENKFGKADSNFHGPEGLV